MGPVQEFWLRELIWSCHTWICTGFFTLFRYAPRVQPPDRNQSPWLAETAGKFVSQASSDIEDHATKACECALQQRKAFASFGSRCPQPGKCSQQPPQLGFVRFATGVSFRSTPTCLWAGYDIAACRHRRSLGELRRLGMSGELCWTEIFWGSP